MNKEKYLVMWEVYKKVPKKGFWNLLFGKKLLKIEQIVHSYNSEEIAEYGFKNLKSNGCIKPILLKVIKE